MSDTAVGIQAEIRLKREKLQQDLAGAAADINNFARFVKQALSGIGLGSLGGSSGVAGSIGMGGGAAANPQTTTAINQLVQNAIGNQLQQIQNTINQAAQVAAGSPAMAGIVNSGGGGGGGRGGNGLPGWLGRFGRYGTAYFGVQAALSMTRAGEQYGSAMAYAGNDAAKQAEAMLGYRKQLFGSVPIVGGLLSQLSDPLGRSEFAVRGEIAGAAGQDEMGSLLTRSGLETRSMLRRGANAGAPSNARALFGINEARRSAEAAAMQNAEMQSSKAGAVFSSRREVLRKTLEIDKAAATARAAGSGAGIISGGDGGGSPAQIHSTEQQIIALQEEEKQARGKIATELQDRLKSAADMSAGERRILAAQISMEHAAVDAAREHAQFILADSPRGAATAAMRTNQDRTRQEMNLKEAGSGDRWFNEGGKLERQIFERDQDRTRVNIFGGMSSRASVLSAQYRGDTDSASLQSLALRQRERTASLLAGQGGRAAADAYNAPGGEAEMERKSEQQRIERSRTLAAAQSDAFSLGSSNTGINAIDRAGGKDDEVRRREIIQGTEARAKATRDLADAEKDATKAAQLRKRADDEEVEGAGKLIAFDLDRARTIQLVNRAAAQNVRGSQLRGTGQRTRASDEDFENGYANQIADARRAGHNEEADALEKERDAARGERAFDKAKDARSVRLDTIRANAGFLHRTGLADAEELRAQIMDDQRDAGGDPRRFKAATQLGIAKLRELKRSLLPVGEQMGTTDYLRQFQERLSSGNSQADALKKITETLDKLQRGGHLQDDTDATNQKLGKAADNLNAAAGTLKVVKVIGR